MNIEAVIGANYGDEGKGLFTDYLCSNRDTPLVVMANGGSQRGHTVETKDGKRHVFHHFSSGTFRNAPTYFPKQFLLNPMQFVKEYDELCEYVKSPCAYRDPNCVIQLPGDIALNWHIEKSRGELKHGSVGCGIWETKYRMYNNSYITLDTFCDLSYDKQIDYIKTIAKKYRDIRCAEEKITNKAEIFDLFMSNGFIDHFISDCMRMKELCQACPIEKIKNIDACTVVFECGQGLKLDQFYGASNDANTTPSFTGAIGIAQILNDMVLNPNNVILNYVSRTYLTKHGAGDFIEQGGFENELKFEDTTNVDNEWQGGLRFAELDYEALLKRCNCDAEMFKTIYGKKTIVKTNIVITHANEVPVERGFLDKISFVSNTKFADDISFNM